MNTPISPVSLVVLALATPAALAQPVLYTAGGQDAYAPPLASGFMSAAGERAPYGSSWSELATGGSVSALAGVSVHGGVPGGVYRAADHFTIPPGQVWRIGAVRTFVYQPGGSAKEPPVAAMNLRVWSGSPAEAQSVVLFGDTNTNRLGSATFANLFRTFATRDGRSSAATDRPVWSVTSRPMDLVLPPGTYWLDYQFLSRDPDRALFVPPIADARAVAGRDDGTARGAVHLQPIGMGAAWLEIEDPGLDLTARAAPCRLPIQVLGTVLEANPADLADESGRPGRDGLTDLSDLLAFMNAYEHAEPLADICGEAGLHDGPDGRVTPADLVAFIAAYAGG